MTWTWKIFRWPLLPVWLSRTEKVDLAVIGLTLTLFIVAAILHARGRDRPILRRTSQALSLVLLGLLFPLCLCVTKGVGVSAQKLLAGDFLVALSFLWLPLLVLGFVAFLGRRFYCHWICPLGFAQDMTGKIHGFKRTRLNERTRRAADLSILITALLGTVLIAWIQRPAPLVAGAGALLGVVLLVVSIFLLVRPQYERRFRRLKYFLVAPWVALAFYVFLVGLNSASGPWCVIANANLRYSAIIPFVGILVAATVIPRAWCRYVCPDGGLLQLLRGRPRQDALD
jgi:polyferredoxin